MRSSNLCLCYRLLHLGQLLVELDLELALKLLDLADNAVLGEVSSMKLCDREEYVSGKPLESGPVLNSPCTRYSLGAFGGRLFCRASCTPSSAVCRSLSIAVRRTALIWKRRRSRGLAAGERSATERGRRRQQAETPGALLLGRSAWLSRRKHRAYHPVSEVRRADTQASSSS